MNMENVLYKEHKGNGRQYFGYTIIIIINCIAYDQSKTDWKIEATES